MHAVQQLNEIFVRVFLPLRPKLLPHPFNVVHHGARGNGPGSPSGPRLDDEALKELSNWRLVLLLLLLLLLLVVMLL